MRFHSAHKNLRRRNKTVRDNVSSIAFADDRFVTPLQAADLLACATVKQMRKADNAWSNESPFYGLLLTDDPVYGLRYEQEYWDGETIGRHAALILSGDT